MNRLKDEKSPYLLQHKNNPVDWFPWCDEAFKKAKEENKPIFLSIGYATCHWCHVMEHESFEDEDIAKLLNETFINIKVDREERPDIDNTYMTVCQMITGQGGWPLTIVMTPDKKPFFAGTYIPKDARFQRLGLRQLIPGIKGMWENEPEKVQKATQRIQEGFEKSLHFESGHFPGSEAVDYAAEQFLSRYDEEYGGFGSAPKFPSPHNLSFLLRQWYATGENRFKKPVINTLRKMRLGGLWDHVGFGFHRYSTDREWLLPHFEKMLYDQALLMMAYTEGWQVTGDKLFEQTVYEIADYVSQKLTSPDGAFYSAEDADSEGEEGKFYVWQKSEIVSLLPDKEAEFILSKFQIHSEGNFEDEATKELTGANIFHLKEPLKGEEEKYSSIRKKLFEDREQRIHPLLDDKILTDWNSLMIAAFAKAGAVFDEPDFIEKAEKAFDFLSNNLLDDHNKLYHRFKDGEAEISAFADDYIFLIQACLELFEATMEAKYLEKAISLSNSFIDLFEDEENGGFYFTSGDSEELLGRQKQIYDGAIPSSNSVAMNCFLKLSRITGDPGFEKYVDAIGKAFSVDIIRSGSSIAHGLQAIQFIENNPKEIVIVSQNSRESLLKELRAIQQIFAPFKVLIAKHPVNSTLKDYSPYIQEMNSIDDKVTYYVCTNQACKNPFTESEKLLKVLKFQS